MFLPVLFSTFSLNYLISLWENSPEHREWLQKISHNLKYFYATGPWFLSPPSMVPASMCHFCAKCYTTLWNCSQFDSLGFHHLGLPPPSPLLPALSSPASSTPWGTPIFPDSWLSPSSFIYSNILQNLCLVSLALNTILIGWLVIMWPCIN